MKRLLIVLMTILMITLLFGCSVKKAEYTEDDKNITEDDEIGNTSNDESADTDDENETETELVTKEWIMEHFDITEDELEGIDVDAIIKKYTFFTEEGLKDFHSKDEFLEFLKLLDEDIKTDISYLFKGGQPEEEISVSQIKTVAFLEGENNENNYWHICVQDKKAYFCLGHWDNMDVKEECEYSETLTDEGISELLSCLDKANLHKWKAEYRGEDDGSTGSWGWHLGIELTDGTVYSWYGTGLIGDNKPENYETVAAGIKHSI